MLRWRSGGGAKMVQLRGEFKGLGSDQASTESGLSSAPYVDEGNLDKLHEEIEKTLAESKTPATADGYLLPDSLESIDGLHVNYRALEEAIKVLPEWRLSFAFVTYRRC
jgi:hypothetical protein